MQQNLKDVVDRIVAIVPIYGDGGDATHGYVAIEAVEEVGQNEPTQAAKSFVSLRCGHRLAVYLEPREVHKHLQAAAYAAQQFWGQRLKRDPYMLMMRASERY